MIILLFSYPSSDLSWLHMWKARRAVGPLHVTCHLVLGSFRLHRIAGSALSLTRQSVFSIALSQTTTAAVCYPFLHSIRSAGKSSPSMTSLDRWITTRIHISSGLDMSAGTRFASPARLFLSLAPNPDSQFDRSLFFPSPPR